MRFPSATLLAQFRDSTILDRISRKTKTSHSAGELGRERVKRSVLQSRLSAKIQFSVVLMLAISLAVSTAFTKDAENPDVVEEEFPELADIHEMIDTGPPGGVVFLVMDYDTEAYYWVLPRLERYVRMLREKWPDLSLAVLSHGDEIFSLLSKNEDEYSFFHKSLRELATTYKVDVQVCGAYAALSGVDESEFADFVDVVASAPAQITDYRQMDYEVVSLEPVW